MDTISIVSGARDTSAASEPFQSWWQKTKLRLLRRRRKKKSLNCQLSPPALYMDHRWLLPNTVQPTHISDMGQQLRARGCKYCDAKILCTCHGVPLRYNVTFCVYLRFQCKWAMRGIRVKAESLTIGLFYNCIWLSECLPPWRIRMPGACAALPGHATTVTAAVSAY